MQGKNLERRPRLAQENQLLRAGGAPQNCVAVGVVAKAVLDGLVAQLEAQNIQPNQTLTEFVQQDLN